MWSFLPVFPRPFPTESAMWELGPDADRPEWREVENSFEKALYSVVNTVEGPYAIGDGGTVIADRGDGWEVVFDDGPRTRDNQLRGLDVTDDGKRIWFAGSSGALGCYDVVGRRKYDYSNPNEMTSTWEGLAVAGAAGSEKVLVANGSGEILPFTVDGFDENWEPVSKPASKGSNVAALAASPDGVGYAVDTSGNAFKTTVDEGWKDIGIVNAQVKFYDIYAGEQGRVYVAAGDGRIYRYDDSYHDWTPIGVAKKSLRAFDIEKAGDRSRMVVIGDSGTIYERTGRDRWEEIPSPVGARLFDIALGETDVIVGNSGIILEHPQKPRDAGSSPDQDQYDDRGEYFDNDQNAPGDSANGGGSSDDGGSSGGSSSGGGSSGSDGSSRSGGSSDSGGSSMSGDSSGSDGGSSGSGESSGSDGSAGDGGSSSDGSASGGSSSNGSGSASGDGGPSSDGSGQGSTSG